MTEGKNTRARKVFRALLRLLPFDSRWEHGEAMEEMFVDMHSGAAGEESKMSKIRIWLSSIGSVVWMSPREHFDMFRQDAGYALRTMRKNPGFATVAVLTLAIGIGANTAIFSVINGVLLEPLPYQDAGRLVIIWNDFGEGGQSLPVVSPQDYRDYREWTQLFEDFAAGDGGTGSLTGNGEPEQADVGYATFNFFPLLGVEPILGRGFLPEEDVVDGPAVALLNYKLWERRYGSDPAIVDSTIQLNGESVTVVGVLPPGFELLLPPEAFRIRDADLWVPMQDSYTAIRNRTYFTVFGRMKAWVTLPQAQAEMDAFAARLQSEHLVHKSSNLRIRTVPFHYDVVKKVRPTLFILLAAVGLVLLIACGNVANLLLARATSRGKEMAIRAALGASRSRIFRQALTESALLAVLGGGLGLLVAAWGLEALLVLRPANLPRMENIALDGTALWFTAGACLLTLLLSGLVPALNISRLELNAVLREGGRQSTASGGSAIRRGLIVGEVALSLVLLISVGLLLQSFLSLQKVHPGFEEENVLTFGLSLPNARYPSSEDRHNFYQQLEGKLRSLPGVEAVSAVSQLPLTGTVPLSPYAYDDETAAKWETLTADRKIITPDFFRVMGTQLRAGRFFDSRDTLDSALVVTVDEMLARKAWPDEDPVGKRLLLPFFREGKIKLEWTRVIGVTEHIRNHDLTRDVREQVNFSYTQVSRRSMSLVVRTGSTPSNLAELVREEVRAMDKDLPVNDLRPMSDYLVDARGQARFTLLLIFVFGGIALALACIGLYGVISYSVSQRTHEVGIRMAMGARQRDIFRLVMGQGLKLVGAGLLVGLIASAAVTRTLGSLLFEVSPTDPAAFLASALVLVLVALAACFIPARRATKVDPLVALRYE